MSGEIQLQSLLRSIANFHTMMLEILKLKDTKYLQFSPSASLILSPSIACVIHTMRCVFLQEGDMKCKHA